MRLLPAILLFAIASCAKSQTGSRFEVASIHPSSLQSGTEGSGREHVDVTVNSVTLRNASLSFCVQWAHEAKFYEVSGPEWLKDLRWDIQAKAEGVHSERELRMMMRDLLAERFHLVLHRENASRPVYTLQNSKAPLKLRQAARDVPQSMRVVDGDFVFTSTSMAEFADQLSDFATVDRPVLDQTGLKDAYDFRLESLARAIRTGESPSVFTAVAELGLQMKASREPVEVLVIEGASREPTPN